MQIDPSYETVLASSVSMANFTVSSLFFTVIKVSTDINHTVAVTLVSSLFDCMVTNMDGQLHSSPPAYETIYPSREEIRPVV